MKDHVIGYTNELPAGMDWGILLVEGKNKPLNGRANVIHLCCYEKEPTPEDLKHLLQELVEDPDFTDIAPQIYAGDFSALIIGPENLPMILKQLDFHERVYDKNATYH